MTYLPDVQVNDERAQLVAGSGFGVDIGGEAGGIAVLEGMLVIAVVDYSCGLAYCFCHLLDESVHDNIAELFVSQPQSQKVRVCQPYPLSILVGLSVTIIGEVLVRVALPALQGFGLGVQVSTVEFECLRQLSKK